MDFSTYLPFMIFALALILLLVGGYYMRAYYKMRSRLSYADANIKSLLSTAEEYKIVKSRLEEAQEFRVRAETQLAEIEKKLNSTEIDHKSAIKEMRTAQETKNEAEKQLELIKQRMEEKELHWKDLEKQRDNAIKDAKAAIVKAGSDLSSKLLEDHKREMDAAKKSSEEITKKTTENLTKEFKGITEAVASIRTQTDETRSRMSKVWKALSTPAGAGHLAEMGLENSLKNLGLEPGRDFIMQYAISGGEGIGLRPDAVIFLPQDMVMVVDSKASKFSLELASTEGGESEKKVLENLGKSMNSHLKALQSKDYKAAVSDAYRVSGRSGKIKHIHMVMYLPNEGMIDHIKRADNEFMHKVERAGLILAGPASLSGLLSLASVNIGMANQAENQSIIIEKVQDLMEGMITMFDHAVGLGRNLRTTANFYDKFAGSVNGRVLPKLRALTQLGVKASSNKELPSRIVSYDIRLADEVITLDAEPEETVKSQQNNKLEKYSREEKQAV